MMASMLDDVTIGKRSSVPDRPKLRSGPHQTETLKACGSAENFSRTTSPPASAHKFKQFVGAQLIFHARVLDSDATVLVNEIYNSSMILVSHA